MLPQPSAENYLRQQAIQREALIAAKRIWGSRPPKDFDAWFAANVDRLVAVIVLGQRAAVDDAESYVADTLDDLGVSIQPTDEVAPDGLTGIASDGRPLDSLMYGSIITAKSKIGDAVDRGLPVSGDVVSAAWEAGLRSVQLRVQTQIADANRVATGLAITSRPGIGYVRMLNPPSCSRCAVLAGRFYRYNAGFDRHPGCDCRHIAAPEDRSGDLRTDPMDYFVSLAPPMQDKIFTIAGARAIREGADIAQVVNARRGAHGLDTAAGLMGNAQNHHTKRRDVYGRHLITTTEGVTKRGVAGKIIRARGRTPKTTPRLMPEDIYRIGEDRDDTLRLLRLNGYLIDRSGPLTGAGSRTGLVPDLAGVEKPKPRPTATATTVDLDAVTAAAEAEAARQRARERAAPQFAFAVSAGVPSESAAAARRTIARIPFETRQELARQNIKLFLTRRVSLIDNQQIRDRYAGSFTADGRSLDETSFFNPSYGDVIISTDARGGSLDVVAHELGHALDYRALRRLPPEVTWQEQGAASLSDSARVAAQRPATALIYRIQDDPYVKWAHERVAGGSGPEYYRAGSQGKPSSGRAEWIAEGYAAVLSDNRPWLVYISGGDEQAADILAWSFRRFGVVT
ncbi:hypothetical protein [Rhodococcus sp. 05-2255-2A2]|uniref:hypothetical protein n=1 Tax=Rhodococcus sp. 05-2255-2A2 TaxID=2022488 RepID=UPI0015C63197|nr:hypothetical protein [Rhodococcus sp. 05-2255-2A2]